MCFGVIQILHILLLLLLLYDLVPDVRVDPQGAGQGHAGPGAGNPAAEGAGHGADDTLQTGQLLQTDGAEGVVAVQDAWDPVTAGVFITTHHALQLLGYVHDDWKSRG